MVVVIGHRGAMGYEPENTLRSFWEAYKQGAGAIELDVHLCKSGELVVIHDDTVDRTTNGKGKVSEMTFQELEKLDAGSGERIPTLDEVIGYINLPINIELKGSGTAEPVYRMIKDNTYRFLVSSFDKDELRYFRKLTPEIRIGVLDEGLPDFELARELNAFSINPPYYNLNAGIVEQAHQKGLQVYTWTVNTENGIRNSLKMNVDGIFTNYPDRALRLKNTTHDFPYGA